MTMIRYRLRDGEYAGAERLTTAAAADGRPEALAELAQKREQEGDHEGAPVRRRQRR